MYNQYQKSDIYNQGGDGGIRQITPGLGIAVSNDDPKFPVVSADLQGGENIEVYAEEGSNKIFIKTTAPLGTPLGIPYHGSIIAPDPLDPTKKSIVGLDQLTEINGNAQIGYGAKIVRCVGTTGTIDLENCRVGYNTDFAPSQGVSYLNGIPMIVINRATGNYTIKDNSGTIMGLAELILLPGQCVFLWTNAQTNWGYVVTDYNGIFPGNIQANDAAVLRKNFSDSSPTSPTANFMHQNNQTSSGSRIGILESGGVLISCKSGQTAALQYAGADRIKAEANKVSITILLSLSASTTSRATINIPPGLAPTVPANGDVWSTATDLFVRLNGVTKTFTLT